ncbi:MAG TPA: pilin [Candidatus Paceibacterota bacterium]|jgi:hypothetical protein|nr:pilin [Candidatus Paceibacterota bacterium]
MKKLVLIALLGLGCSVGIAQAQFNPTFYTTPTNNNVPAKPIICPGNQIGFVDYASGTAGCGTAATAGNITCPTGQTAFVDSASGNGACGNTIPTTNVGNPTFTPSFNTLNPNAFCAGGTCTYTPLEPLPGFPTTFGGKNSNNSISTEIGDALKIFIWLGAIVAVVILILGALTYMFSDVVTNKKNAIDRIRRAMWGILILGGSWLILNTINPQLVNLNLKIDPFAPINTSTNTPTTNNIGSAGGQQSISSCMAQCGAAGGSVRVNADNSTSCTCNVSASPF